jgi:hypothetical protein
MIYKSNSYARVTMNDGVTTLVIMPKYIEQVNGNFAYDFVETTELWAGVTQPSAAAITIIKPKAGTNPDLENFLSTSADWRMTKLELFYSDSGTESYRKVSDGLIFTRSETATTVTFTSRGYLDLLNITMVETPLFRNRKVATSIPSANTDAEKYAALKKQDPTIIEGSSVGIINAILWIIGGRPYKYKSLYDTQYSEVAGQRPKFYYDCTASIINPEWLWFNYENLLNDLTSLCKAAGGILNQDLDGVVRFKNIISTKQAANGFLLTDSNFESMSINELGTEPYSKIVTTYTPRYLAGSQEVFSAVINEYLNYNQSVERLIQFNKPVYKLVNKTISGQLTDTIVGDNFKYVKDKMNVVDTFGTKQIVSAKIEPHRKFYITRYVWNEETNKFTKQKDGAVVPSQTTTLYIKNTLNQANTVFVGEVSLYGRALEAAQQENYILQLNQYPTVSGYKELRIGDNPYVQSESQAVRLVNISKYLMEKPRKVLTVNGVPYKEKLKLGETITVNSTFYAISGEFKITSMSFSPTLATTNLTLLSLSGLYSDGNMFVVGSSYQDDDSKILSF